MLDSLYTDIASSRGSVRSSTLRVLSVPPRHPYIDAVKPISAVHVGKKRTLAWEPDPIFEPGAVAKIANDIDLVHVHFSFDYLTVPQAHLWLHELRTHRIPLVITVHDLRNPHHETRDRHDEMLAVLVPAADAVITLTQGAASEIRERFGVDAKVVPHPTMAQPHRSNGAVKEAGLATLHLKEVRQSVKEPMAVIEAAAAGAADAGGRLRVDVHPDALKKPSLFGLESMGGIELAVHTYFDDLELEQYIRRSHVSVLPYHWGTHSGWLELARDLGTRVVAPDCGHYADQWSEVVPYTNNEHDGFDPESLRKAVAYALSQPVLPVPDHSARLAEVAAVRRVHESLYRSLLQ